MLDHSKNMFNSHNRNTKDKDNSLEFKFLASEDFTNRHHSHSHSQNHNHSHSQNHSHSHSHSQSHSQSHSGHSNLFELIDQESLQKDNMDNIDNDIKRIEGISYKLMRSHIN